MTEQRTHRDPRSPPSSDPPHLLKLDPQRHLERQPHISHRNLLTLLQQLRHELFEVLPCSLLERRRGREVEGSGGRGERGFLKLAMSNGGFRAGEGGRKRESGQEREVERGKVGRGVHDAQILLLHQPFVEPLKVPVLGYQDVDDLSSADRAVGSLLGLEGVGVDRVVSDVLRRRGRTDVTDGVSRSEGTSRRHKTEVTIT